MSRKDVPRPGCRAPGSCCSGGSGPTAGGLKGAELLELVKRSPNNSMLRTALRAAADAGRWPDKSNDMKHDLPEQPSRFELAPQDRMAAVEGLARQFFREVIGWEYDEVLVTDESELSDFADVTGDREQEVQTMLRRMEPTYGLDPAGARSIRIVDLLEYLSIQRPAGGRPAKRHEAGRAADW